jgi:tetratricopeptide (TPR) repeat protein
MRRLLTLVLTAAAAVILTAQAPPPPAYVPVPAPAAPAPPAAMPMPTPVPLPQTEDLTGEEIAESEKGCEGGRGVNAQFQLAKCTALILAKKNVTPKQRKRARYLRALAYFNLGHIDKSESDLSAVIQADPQAMTAWRGRAKARFYRKNYKAAIADATEALKLKPNDPEALYHRANSQYELRDYAKALADYDAAIKADPKYAHAYADRGITQLRRENFKAAIADIQKAIALEGKPIPWAQAQLDEAKAAQAALDQRQTRSLTPSTAPPSAGSGGATVMGAKPSAGVDLDGPPVLKTRVALIIGNSAYTQVSKLPNAANDAADVAKQLEAAGYKLYGYPKLNMTRQQMFDAVKAFQAAAATADTAIVWYAGHGQEFEAGGTKMSNWLIPVDFPLDGDVIEHGVPLSRLMTAVTPAKTLRVVVVDACRNSNIPTGGRGSRGFTVEERSDMLIVYSTQAGRLAEDGPKGSRNSPFAAAFLETMSKHGKIDVRQFFGGVAQGTIARTKNLNPPQEPEKIDKIHTIATLPLAP